MINVAIVSPDHSLEPVDKVIEEQDFGCSFHRYIYKKMTDIDEIYHDCRGKCDVMFFSGELGYHYIRHKFPDIRIPCAFTAYEPIDVLSILLNFQISHPEIRMNRVFCDFLTETNHFMGLPQYLPKEHQPYFYTERHYDYRHITDFAKQLWEHKKIDMILSRSINNLKKLDELGIPYVAVFPSEEMIVKSIRNALNELRLDQIAEKEILSILIRLPFSEEIEQEEQEYREATLYKFLADYRKSRHLHFSIEQGFNQFELHSEIPAGEDNAGALDFLRHALTELKRKLDFPFRIGIGIGASRDRSRCFAEQALMEANRYGRNDAFLVDKEDIVLGPLSQDARLAADYTNEKALLFAREQGISDTNILKLVSLFQEEKNRLLSSQSLSSLLGVTGRSASRILAKLLELGMVEQLRESEQPEKAGRQGRPIHYFRFQEERFREMLFPEDDSL